MKKVSIWKRVISCIVTFAMLITMLPADAAKAADTATTGMDINIHYYDTDEKYGGKVYLQYWDDPKSATISTEGELFAAWKVTRYPLKEEAATEGTNWYGLNIKGSVNGFQLLNETGKEATGTIYNKALENYKGDLYYKDSTWYTENPVKNTQAKKLALIQPKEEFFVVGDIVADGWNLKTTAQLSKEASGTYAIALKNVAAGKYSFKVLQDPANFSWDLAWGGTGAGGNCDLTVEELSNVTISIDPADAKRQAVVKTEKVQGEMAALKSPVNTTTGAVKFQYVGAIGQDIAVKGNFAGGSDWKQIKATEKVVTTTTGTSIYTAVTDVITGPGVYSYGILSLDAKGEQKDWLGDPLNKAVYGDNAAFVRNPVVKESGLVKIYMPDGANYKVYYQDVTKLNSAVVASSAAIKIGTVATEEEAKLLGFSIAKMSKDTQFADGMYSAKIADGLGTYVYTIVDEENKIVGDPCNFVNQKEIGQAVHTFTVSKFDKDIVNLQSPVDNKDGSVTFQYFAPDLASGSAVSVAGGFNGWGDAVGKDVLTLDKEAKGIWSTTLKGFTPGVYEYKFVVGASTWIQDPLAELSSNGNSALVVAGLTTETELQVEKEKALTLPTKGKLYEAGSLTAKDVNVSFALKDTSVAGVTLQGGILSVAKDCAAKTIALEITDGTNKGTISVSVVDKMYTYTVHYYSPKAEEYAKRDLWIWEAGGKAYNTGYAFNQENVTDAVGRSWATATYSYPTNAINMIVRSNDGAWTYKEEEKTIKIPEGKDSTEVWVIKGNPYIFTEWAEKFQEPERRYIVIEYDRPAKDYSDWNVYTWNSGAASSLNVSNYFEEVNGKYVATIEIGEKTSSIGFLIRKGTPEEGEVWVKDVEGDRSIQAPLDQKVVKVKATEGSLKLETVPYNTGCELQVNDHKMVYYYRDDALFRAGTLNQLQKVEVEIDGQRHAMTYDAATERYVFTVENPAEKEYAYRFFATDKAGKETESLDLFNSNKKDGKSIIVYKDIDVKVAGKVNAAAINYEQNAVLSVTTSAALETVKVTDCYVDLTALGGKAKTPIETDLMEVSIGVSDAIAPGKKELPITVVDQYGKRHTGVATVQVKEKVSNDDFDWDEAVIYFMVTDRFFDGNASNNDAYGVGDYNLNGPSSYHGGDFAGVTEKLDYLKDLGVNTIWITPIVENILDDLKAEVKDDKGNVKEMIASHGYHGYWASSFTKLNKHLGTMKEFHTLIDEAHARDMKIMVDIVANHAGYGTKESEEFKGMFRTQDVADHDVLGSLSGLPDFATENEAVRNKLVEWQTKWVSEYGVTEQGNSIDYFRVDTVKHVDSTTWAAMKNSLTKVSSTFKMIGEYAGAGYVDDFGYLNSGKMDSLLDFGFNDMAGKFVKGSLDSIEEELEVRNKVINNTGTLGSFIGSHDENGFKYDLMETAGFTEAQAQALTNVAAALQITAKGQPIIYYGEEIGLTGANNYPYQTNRYDMKFDNLTEQEKNTLAHYKKLLTARNQYSKVFAKGSRTKLAGSNAEKFLVFERNYKKESVVVGLNIADTEKEVTFVFKNQKGNTVTELYSGKTYKVAEDGKVTIKIPAAKDGGTILLASAKTGTGTATTTDKKTDSTGKVTEATVQVAAGIKDTDVEAKNAIISAEVSKKAVTRAVASAVTGSGVKAKVNITVSEGAIKAQLALANVHEVEVKMVVSNAISTNKQISEIQIIASKALLKAAKAAGKTLTFTIINEDGDIVSSWGVLDSDLTRTTGTIKDVNISLSVVAAKTVTAAKKTLSKDTSNTKGLVVKFNQTGKLITNATVKVYVAGQEGVKAGATVYVYRLNSSALKFEAIPEDSVKVSSDGYITFSTTEGGNYVILPKKASSKARTDLVKQVTAKVSKTTLKKGKTASVSIAVPSTVKKLASFSEKNMATVQSGQVGAKITYKSSKKSVATISSTGKIKAKKKGKTTISITITLSDGTKQTIKKTIKVKK